MHGKEWHWEVCDLLGEYCWENWMGTEEPWVSYGVLKIQYSNVYQEI